MSERIVKHKNTQNIKSIFRIRAKTIIPATTPIKGRRAALAATKKGEPKEGIQGEAIGTQEKGLGNNGQKSRIQGGPSVPKKMSLATVIERNESKGRT